MGVYMGIFNFFITFPQIVNGFFGGYIVKYAFGGQAVFALVMAGLFMFLGAFSVLRVKELKTTVRVLPRYLHIVYYGHFA